MKIESHGLPIALSFTALLMAASIARGASWTPPVGIPPPSFGINEVAPASPNPWTASTTGFYYVDATKAAATDDNNPYGTPAKPRQTIPTLLPAGADVELHGTYDTPHSSPSTIVVEGTTARPVFIRGVSAASRPLARRSWEIQGTYAIVENIEFGPTPDLLNTGSVVILLPSSHVVLRNSELHGTLSDGGLGIVNWLVPYGEVYTGPGVIDNVVIYNNSIHDNGDVNATFDQDVHGISVSDHVNHLWVVDNQIARNSGDGIQINAETGQGATTHHIYVGRNVSHDNKQSGFWTKYATDVIFSQNETYGHRPSNSSLGQCMGAQYAPDWVWFLFNHVHDCEYGVTQMSDDGEVARTFIIGNVIENIHASQASDPTSGWGPSAVMIAGGSERHVINNTIYNVDSGVNDGTTAGTLEIADNIISDITQAAASHILLDYAVAGTNTVMYNDLLFGNPRIDWGNGQVLVTASQLAQVHSLESDPQFVNAAGGDFHVAPTSPAVGAGEVNVAYTTFQQRYGLSIATDIQGTPRPPTGGYTLGAYERACGSAPVVPGAPQGFTASHTSSTITLQWTAPASIGCAAGPSYILEVGTSPGLSNLANAPIGTATALSIPATGVPAGTYYFRVLAENTAGTSPASNEAALSYGAAPGAPRGLVASLTGTKVTLTWIAPTTGGSATSYLLGIGSASGLTDLGSFPLASVSTTLTFPALPKGTYYLSIRAENGTGISGPTNEAKLIEP